MFSYNGENYCLGCFKIKSEDEAICSVCGYAEGRKPESSTALIPGTKLHDRYVVGRQIGHGGFGITYLAFDLQEARIVAVKEYFPDGLVTRTMGEAKVLIYSEDGRESFETGTRKFLEEAKTLAKFNKNPNIISVYNSFTENETAYFVMEYIKGINLKQRLQQTGVKMSVEETLRIMLPIMDALDEVHQFGILHRDISPDNIYITADQTVKLLDFGAARQIIGDKSKSLSVILKPGFAPEEQYRRKGVQGPWTDIYALGATMYNVLSGQLLPDALDRLRDDEETRKPSELGVNIGQELENVIMKSVMPNAEERFRTIKDFRNAIITAAIADGSFNLSDQSKSGRTRQLFSRQRVIWVGSIAALIILLTGFTLILNGNDPESNGIFGNFRGNLLINVSNEVTEASTTEASTTEASTTEASTTETSTTDASTTEASTSETVIQTIAPTGIPTSDLTSESTAPASSDAATITSTTKPSTTSVSIKTTLSTAAEPTSKPTPIPTSTPRATITPIPMPTVAPTPTPLIVPPKITLVYPSTPIEVSHINAATGEILTTIRINEFRLFETTYPDHYTQQIVISGVKTFDYKNGTNYIKCILNAYNSDGVLAYSAIKGVTGIQVGGKFSFSFDLYKSGVVNGEYTIKVFDYRE